MFGCTIEQACNYNPEATDDGSCDFTVFALMHGRYGLQLRPRGPTNDGSCEYANFLHIARATASTTTTATGCATSLRCQDAPTRRPATTTRRPPTTMAPASTPTPLYGVDRQEDANANGVRDIFEVQVAPTPTCSCAPWSPRMACVSRELRLRRQPPRRHGRRRGV